LRRAARLQRRQLRFSPFVSGRFVPVPSPVVKEQTPLQQKGKNNMNKIKNNPEEPKAAPMYQNQVRLVGFLGKDPEEYENRTILSLATKNSWKKADSDEWESHTDWHRVMVWDELASKLGSLAKGDHVLVEGELRSSSYLKHVNVGVDTVSVPSIAWEIRARSVRKLARKQKSAKKPAKALKAAA
jgi:single stranded DNA-binding protein